jgi:hypothetical protein
VDRAQDMGEWLVLTDIAMNLWVPYKAGKFLTNWATVSFSGSILLYVVRITAAPFREPRRLQQTLRSRDTNCDIYLRCWQPEKRCNLVALIPASWTQSKQETTLVFSGPQKPSQPPYRPPFHWKKKGIRHSRRNTRILWVARQKHLHKPDAISSELDPNVRRQNVINQAYCRQMLFRWPSTCVVLRRTGVLYSIPDELAVTGKHSRSLQIWLIPQP